ncbi:BRO family protein [Lactococcus hircilactis]|uniref:BRO family protein n=1 Tax=Lactococcus hircilactis TaxID=1494462 RepID=UPI003FA291C2
MNELQNFNFNSLPVRTVLVDNDPWFVAKDVADILEYSETAQMTRRLDKEDSMSVKLTGMNMKSTIINESGLYEAIIGSKKKDARQFKRWITHDVLPTIRKHGMYMTEEEASQVRIPTSQRELVQLALSANEETNQRVDEIDDRLTDIEMNKLITTEDKGTIDAHVRKKVHSICKDFKLEQKAKSMLFQELGSSIKKLFNVPNRGRLKDKDFMSALEFIDSWQPSSVTKAQIKQLDLF